MSSKPSTLLAWLPRHLPHLSDRWSVDLVAGDASPRRYYRVSMPIGTVDGDGAEAEAESDRDGSSDDSSDESNDHFSELRTWIAVISPPSEKNAEFLYVHGMLEAAGIRVPELYAADPELGFILVEDLGDEQLLAWLEEESALEAQDWYKDALMMLADTVAIPVESTELPPYDAALLQTELNLFQDWFLEKLLDYSSEAAKPLFADLSSRLIENAFAQPQVVVHRDFHSRNLMVIDDSELVAIDFQDACIGAITYDAASLLKDCYIAWPRAQQLTWLNHYQQLLTRRNLLPPTDQSTFIGWFDLTGLQRHIKCLGIFARLYLRDGKAQYLDDLPLVLAYVREVFALYGPEDSAIAAFSGWFEAEVMPLCRKQSWFREVAV